MAHKIEYNEQKGTHSFFTVKEKAWHNLGVCVEKALTSAEAIKAANLDFEVVKLPMLEQFPDGKGGFDTVASTESFTTLRTDTKKTLGFVGKGYHVLPNIEAFSFFDSIVGDGEAIYETAGVLDDGKRIFITAKLPDYISVNGKPEIEQYIFLTNGHDGKNAVKAAFTPVRIVCNNTLTLALQSMTNSISLRHTVNMQEKLKAAHQLMGIKNLYKTELEEIFSAMANTKATTKQYEKLIVNSVSKGNKRMIEDYGTEKGSTRFKNTVKDILEYAFSHETQKTRDTKGTIFGAMNAVSGFFQNQTDWKGDVNDKLSNIMDGDVALKSELAFNEAKKLLQLV